MLPDRFTITSENETGSSLLVLQPTGELVLYHYQLEMLAHNPDTCILTPEVRRKDEEVRLCYTVSPYMALQEYLRNRKLTKQEFLDLLLRITSTLQEGRELLLNERNFLLREDLIQVDLKTSIPYLVYIPAEISSTPPAPLKDFTLQLITKTARIEIKPGDHYLQRIIEYCKAGDFCTDGLKKLLQEIKFKNVSPLQSPMGLLTPVPEETDGKRNGDPWGLFTRELPETEGAESVMEAFATAVGSMDVKLIGTAVFSQIALVVFCLAIEALMKEKGIGQAVRYAGTGAFALVVDLLVFKFLISPKKQNTEALRDKEEDGEQEPEEPARAEQPEPEGTAILRYDETMLLTSDNTALLVHEGIAGKDTHELVKDRTLIGRNQSVCDILIQEKSVGRIHAEIIRREGRYFILDKYSQNGTFVNEERLLPDEEKELRHNDRVVFSDRDFRFIWV